MVEICSEGSNKFEISFRSIQNRFASKRFSFHKFFLTPMCRSHIGKHLRLAVTIYLFAKIYYVYNMCVYEESVQVLCIHGVAYLYILLFSTPQIMSRVHGHTQFNCLGLSWHYYYLGRRCYVYMTFKSVIEYESSGKISRF